MKNLIFVMPTALGRKYLVDKGPGFRMLDIKEQVNSYKTDLSKILNCWEYESSVRVVQGGGDCSIKEFQSWYIAFDA